MACLFPKTEAARPARRWRALPRVAPHEGVACPACGADCDPPEEGEARSRTSRGGCGVVGPPAKSGWPVLPVHRGEEAFDLLDVRPFMASQPLRIGQHGSLEDLSRPRHRRRT